MAVTKQRAASNQDAVEALIRVTPGITRQELAQALQLSITTINPIVTKALEGRRITEQVGARADGSVGRPRSGLVVAGDLPGFGLVVWTHGALSTRVITYDGRVRLDRLETVGKVPTAETISQVARDAAHQAIEGVEVARPIILSVPAPYEHGYTQAGRFRGRFAPEAEEAWFTEDPATVLGPRLAVPILVENDSNVAAAGEGHSGVAAGQSLAIYIRLSDRGIGAGLLVEGRLLRGAEGFAGEISHARVDYTSTVICTCGSRGCLRTKLGTNLLRQLRPTYGDELDYGRMLELVDLDEPGPVRVFEDAGRQIGISLAHIVTFLNPSAIVVEAGSARASECVVRGIAEWLEQSTPPFLLDSLDLRPAVLGARAVDIGALALARQWSVAGFELP